MKALMAIHTPKSVTVRKRCKSTTVYTAPVLEFSRPLSSIEAKKLAKESFKNFLTTKNPLTKKLDGMISMKLNIPI